MKVKSQLKDKEQRQFIPHDVAIQRVKRSFERSKKNQRETPVEFVEVK